MWKKPENDQFVDQLYLACERVQPGTYKQIGNNRVIVLDHEDFLPASLDGRVACYQRVDNDWAANHAASPFPASSKSIPVAA